MSDSEDWSFPESQRPTSASVAFDLDATLDAVVALRAEIPEDAFTAQMLGTERGGSGVVIAEGIVLTIGYLVTEASSVWLTTRKGQVVAGYPLAYDQVTGFGLVRALGPLAAPAIARGSIASLAADDPVFVISHGGRRHALRAKVVEKRPFAGYWEYLLEEAVFTTPAHPEWSGAAVVDGAGRLVGIGSLLVQESSEAKTVQGNMAVPIDLLAPILTPLLETGRTGLPPRPWLGLYAGESDGQVLVGGVAEGGPARKAGVLPGDLVIDVAGTRVNTLAAFLRAVWKLGPAGTTIPLSLGREGDLVRVSVASVDRNDLLRKPSMH